MRILLSNDDGYFAPGLNILAQYLSQLAEIVVVAPERNRSGASNSLTLDRPLTVREAHNGFRYVNGTPTAHGVFCKYSVANGCIGVDLGSIGDGGSGILSSVNAIGRDGNLRTYGNSTRLRGEARAHLLSSPPPARLVLQTNGGHSRFGGAVHERPH